MALLVVVESLLWLVAASAAILLCGLVVRNPHTPNWVRSEGVASATCLFLTAAIAVAVSVAAEGLTAARIHYLVSAALILATFILSLLVFWKLFQVGERLRRANQGLSPFARLKSAPKASIAEPAASI